MLHDVLEMEKPSKKETWRYSWSNSTKSAWLWTISFSASLVSSYVIHVIALLCIRLQVSSQPLETMDSYCVGIQRTISQRPMQTTFVTALKKAICAHLTCFSTRIRLLSRVLFHRNLSALNIFVKLDAFSLYPVQSWNSDSTSLTVGSVFSCR